MLLRADSIRRPVKLLTTKWLRRACSRRFARPETNLQPARIGFGTGKAYINTNRDQKIGDAYHMGYAPEGSSDKTVSVVFITKPSGEPISVYFNYPVHSVVMFLAKTKDGLPQISGDFGGWTSNYVEEHFKGAVALFTMGPAGDQNPILMGPITRTRPTFTMKEPPAMPCSM